MNYNKSEYDEADEEYFRCPNCKYYFSLITKPYILPCNHNMCIKCIDLLIKENKPICSICNSTFKKEERNSFQTNIVFLNILSKILETKVILCKKCNKIFYWKEHYQLCDQVNFSETNLMFNNIKLACEEGIRLLKLFHNNKTNILFTYKNNIYENLKKRVKEISETFKNEINIEFNKFFSASKKIDVKKYKKEIISFLQLCLLYNSYFDTKEISLIIKKYNSNLSPIDEIKTKKNPINELPKNDPRYKDYSPFTNKVLSSINKNCLILSTKKDELIKPKKNINENRNQNLVITEIKNRANNKPYFKINQYKIKDRNLMLDSINTNKDYYSKSYMKKRLLGQNNKKTKTVNINLDKSNKKKYKFNIYDLLNETGPIEEDSKKKIIVGLKDVRIITNENDISKKSLDKDKNFIHIRNKSTYFKDKKDNNIQPYTSVKKNNIINDNELDFCEIGNEKPSLSVLKSIDYTKRIYPLNAEDKRKKLLKHQIACKDEENGKNVIIKNFKKNFDYDNNNIINNKESNKKNFASMNKLFKHFNKIKDIVNELNNFKYYFSYISDYISNEVDYRLLLLKRIIQKDYNLLLNEISYNYNQSPRRGIVSYIENTKKIGIYVPNLDKYKIKNFESIIPHISNFNK